MTAWKRREIIGGQTLLLGDCREILPGLTFDAVCTDPPYGIGYQRGSGGKGLSKSRPVHDGKAIVGDSEPFDPAMWIQWPCIIWGANHYAASLPHGRWLAWNKLGDLEPWDDFSDVEFAWQNTRAADRIFSLMWKGLVKATERDEPRVHPTQKPVALMGWCLSFLPDAQTILDPFAGSGTVAVACERLGRSSVSVEIDPDYFDTACRRVEAATRQPDMFITPPPKPQQETLL